MSFTFFLAIYPKLIDYLIMFVYSIESFLKARLILTGKVVPSNTFKLGGEKVNMNQGLSRQANFFFIINSLRDNRHSVITMNISIPETPQNMSKS